YEDRMLVPTLHFRDGAETVARELFEYFKGAGLKVKRKEVEAALQKGYAAQRQFTERIQTAGRAALKRLQETGEIGIILLGRTYNVNDPGVNLDVPKKLRDFYGVNVIPMDFL